MQDARAQSLGHKIQLYESMEKMKYGIQQHMFQLWDDIQNGPESCKQLMLCMLNGSNTETSEMHYTRGMQSNAQMNKPTQIVPMQAQSSGKMDLNQNEWASATPKSVAIHDENEATKHMQTCKMQGPKA